MVIRVFYYTLTVYETLQFYCLCLKASITCNQNFIFGIIYVEFDLYLQRRGGRGEQKWKEKAKVDKSPTESEAAVEVVTNALGKLRVTESDQSHVLTSSAQFGNAQLTNQAIPGLAHRAIWKPKAYGTTSGAAVIEGEKAPTNGTSTENKGSNAGLAVQGGAVGLSQLFKSNQIEKFIVDNSTYTQAQIRATFYPKFENEKSDQEVFLYSLCFILKLHLDS